MVAQCVKGCGRAGIKGDWGAGFWINAGPVATDEGAGDRVYKNHVAVARRLGRQALRPAYRHTKRELPMGRSVCVPLALDDELRVGRGGGNLSVADPVPVPRCAELDMVEVARWNDRSGPVCRNRMVERCVGREPRAGWSAGTAAGCRHPTSWQQA